METQDQNNEQEINLLEIAHVLVKRKMIIIKVCIAAIIISVCYSLTLPNIYSATAKVLPPQKETGGLSAMLGGQASALAGLAVPGGLSGGNDLYLGMIKSRSVEDAVIRRFDLMRVYKQKSLEGARRVLEQSVTSKSGKDGIITISADDEDPKRAALLANAIVEELGRTAVRLNLTKAGTERVFLEKRLELVKKDLRAAEEDLKRFGQNNRIFQVDSQAKVAIESMARMKADLAAKEVQLSVLRNNQTDQSSDVRALEAGIGRLKAEIGRLSGSVGDSQGIPSVGSVPSLGLQYARKMREMKTQEAIFEQLTKQYEVAKLGEAKDSSTLQILDEAVVPIRKSKPSRSVIVISTTLTALLISVCLVFIVEYMENMSDKDRESLKKLKNLALSLK